MANRLALFILRRQWLVVTLITLGALALPTAVVIYSVLSDWHDHSSVELQHLVQQDLNIDREMRLHLARLNSQFPPASPCDEHLLRAMQLAEFYSHYLQEFSYIDNDKIICTTSEGVLPHPIALMDYDLGPTPEGVYFARQYPIPIVSGAEHGTALRIHSFQAFLRDNTLVERQFPWVRIGIFQPAKKGQPPRYLIGFDQIVPPTDLTLEQSHYWYQQNHFVRGECYKENTCAVIAIDIFDYIDQQRDLLALLLIIIMLTTSTAALSASYLYRYHQSLHSRLRRELNQQSLICHYQPVIDINDGALIGCEVLCRWQPDQHSLIMPDDFLTGVEANQQTQLLTQLVVSKALTELKQQQLLGQLHIAINAFPQDITDGHLLELLKTQAPQYLYQIIVELTEREIDDLQALKTGIHDLRNAGVRVAIDDFGTGYSNLQHLKDLQVDYLKIDKAFIWAMDEQSLRHSLLDNIIDIARTLKLQTVAEGVETAQQFKRLSGLGVSFSQGYLHGKPMPASELAALFQRSHRKHP